MAAILILRAKNPPWLIGQHIAVIFKIKLQNVNVFFKIRETKMEANYRSKSQMKKENVLASKSFLTMANTKAVTAHIQ